MDSKNLRYPWLLLALLVAAVGAGTEPDEAPCPMNATEPAPDGAHVVDGNLLAAGRSYSPAQFRRSRADGGYLLCSCAVTRCMRKCCAPGMVNIKGKGCSAPPEEANGKFENFPVPKFVNGNQTNFETYETDKFRLVYGKVVCPKNEDKYRLQPFQSQHDNFRVSETGWLLNGTSKTNLAPPGLFCLERYSDDGFQIAAVLCSLTAEELNITVTPANDGSSVNSWYMFGMLLSLPFLLATFLVYALIKELRNLHGKTLMCHVATLLVAYTSLLFIQLTTKYLHPHACTIFAYITQFSFVASFFWLNVMCFDLWWTFSGFRPSSGNAKDYEAKKFRIYSIYSWGCPSLISAFTFCMNVSSYGLFGIHPQLGEYSCWFGTYEAKWLYFYGPIGVLLFANLMMFIYTAVMIVKQTRGASAFGKPKRVDREKQRFMLCLNLFIVMGINWSAEILSFAIGSNNSYVWYVSDIGNTLQGVFIFIIFVCKKRVFELLKKKFCSGHQSLAKSSNSESKTMDSDVVSKTGANKTLEMITYSAEDVTA